MGLTKPKNTIRKTMNKLIFKLIKTKDDISKNEMFGLSKIYLDSFGDTLDDETFSKWMTNNDDVMICKKGENVVGYYRGAVFNTNMRYGELYGKPVYSLSDLASSEKGVGKKLVNKSFDRGIELGVNIFITVPWKESLIKYYESFGFAVTDIAKGNKQYPSLVMDCFKDVKSLTVGQAFELGTDMSNLEQDIDTLNRDYTRIDRGIRTLSNLEHSGSTAYTIALSAIATDMGITVDSINTENKAVEFIKKMFQIAHTYLVKLMAMAKKFFLKAMAWGVASDKKREEYIETFTKIGDKRADGEWSGKIKAGDV